MKLRRCIAAWLALLWLSQHASAAEPLRIGLAAPLSGPDAIFGAQIKLGVDQAAADLNARGGILDRPIELVAADDHNDAKKGQEAAERLIKARVAYVIGDFSSAVTVPASLAYSNANVLDLTPSATSPLVTERGLPLVFRLCSREDQQSAAALRFLKSHRINKVALVHDRTTNGKAFADAVRAGLSEAGAAETYYGSFAQDAHDISTLVTRIRASGAQIVIWTGGPAGGALLARQLHDTRIRLLGGIAMASDDFASLAGSSADGTLMIFPQDPRLRPEAAALLQSLKSKGQEPYDYTFYAYAGMQVLEQAAIRAKSTEPKDVAAEMHSGATFQTVIGPVAFDAKGDPTTSDLTVYIWHKGPTGRMGFATPAEG